MKRFIILALAFIPNTIFAQINFEKGNWTDVLAKAKQENKMIMVDFYTTWCSPCKAMDKDIFPLKEVAEFYNTNFINYKIDAEKGEGISLAEKYNVTVYPTFIFTDANGTFQHQSTGFSDAEEFINHAKDALDPTKRLSTLINKEKTITKAEKPAYLRELKDSYVPYTKSYKAYINSLSKKELATKATFDLMLELGTFEEDKFTFNKIFENKKSFIKTVGKQKVNRYFYNQFLYKIYDADEESTTAIYDEINKLGFNFAEKIKAETKLSSAMYQGKGYDEFVNNAKLFIKKHIPDNNPEEIHSAIFLEAVKFFHNSPKVKDFAVELANQLIASNYKVGEVCAFLGQKYATEGDFKKALNYYQKSSDYFDKNGGENISKAAVEKLQKRLNTLKKGEYTFNGKGFDAYNGLTIKIAHPSSTNIGELEELEGVTIKDGKFTLKGTVKEPMHAIWGIFDNEKFIVSDNIILDPGTYSLVMNEDGTALVEGSYYNSYILNNWRTLPEYKETLKELQKVGNDPNFDVKNPEIGEKYFKLNNTVNTIKKDYLTDILKNHPNPVVKVFAAYEGNLYYSNAEDKSGEEYLSTLNELLPNHYLVKTMQFNNSYEQEMEAMRKTVEVGKAVKSFKSLDHLGNEIDVADVLKKNDYVLIEFWASWCGPCRGAIPHLKDAYKKYKDKGFEIISFSIDNKKEDWDKAYKEENIPWIDLSDLLAMKSPIANMYGVTGVPASYLIDKNGKIIGAEMRGEKLDKTLKEVFGF